MNDFFNRIRAVDHDIVKYYELEVTNAEPLGEKALKIYDASGNVYFFKETTFNALEKYQFLIDQGINNVLFPTLNRDRKYITRTGEKAFYISDFVETLPSLDEVRAQNMFNELHNLHQMTGFKRQLSPASSRPKFEELTSQLDYKFRVLENYVRGVENKSMHIYTMPVLANYQYILDAKKELVRLQKRIISSVKARDGIHYSYIHNHPRLDHLLNVRGAKYLTSIENGKIGISSLDMAKLYLENEDLNIDLKSMILDYYRNAENPFYYDYFRYLVLVMYVKRITISTEEYVNAQNFINVSASIQKYFHSFSDYQEQVSEEDESNHYQ